MSTDEESYTNKPNVICLFSSSKDSGGTNQMMEFMVQRLSKIDLYQVTYEDFVPDKADIPPQLADDVEDHKEADMDEGGGALE